MPIQRRRAFYRAALVLIAALAAAVAGCGEPPGWEEPAAPPPPVGGPEAPPAPDVRELPVITPAAELPALRTILVDTAVDLSADGSADRLQLWVDAERDAGGQIMWDDGQRWLLAARIGGAAYPLFDDYVQIGRLQVRVVEETPGAVPRILVLEDAGAGIRLHDFVFDAGRAGFAQSLRYTISGNVVFAGPRIAGP